MPAGRVGVVIGVRTDPDLGHKASHGEFPRPFSEPRGGVFSALRSCEPYFGPVDQGRTGQRAAPNVTEVGLASAMIPTEAPRELRDKALFALLCLTGVRIAALVWLRVRHVDQAQKSVT